LEEGGGERGPGGGGGEKNNVGVQKNQTSTKQGKEKWKGVEQSVQRLYVAQERHGGLDGGRLTRTKKGWPGGTRKLMKLGEGETVRGTKTKWLNSRENSPKLGEGRKKKGVDGRVKKDQ